MIRCTLVQNGCVLLYDEDGQQLGANLAIACLMEFESMLLQPAIIHMLRFLPQFKPNQCYLKALRAWSEKRTKIGL